MDWDLQAIVGCSNAPATIMDNPHLIFSQHVCSEQDYPLCNFQEFSETTTVVDELEELYKPFYPIVSNSSAIADDKTEQVKVAVQDLHNTSASKCKKSKEKKKNKKVVKHVTASNGVSDAWAWRKYGQKPIKGSSYPRSYYRCSSSKGCLARKHVERSHLDPGVFIVTYTAEHSDPHSHPTRKNSQPRKNSSIIAPPITHDDQQTLTPVMMEAMEDEHVPSVELEQSKELKKEEDFVQGDNWSPRIQVEEIKEVA